MKLLQMNGSRCAMRSLYDETALKIHGGARDILERNFPQFFLILSLLKLHANNN